MTDREPGPSCAIAGIRPATLLLAALVARLATQPQLALFEPGSHLAWWCAGAVAVGQELIQRFGTALPPRRAASQAHVMALGATLLLLLALQAAGSRGAATVVAGLLLGQALPIAPFSGSALLRIFFRRRTPVAAAATTARSADATRATQDWIAERLLARVGGSLLALLLAGAALSERVRADPWLAAGTLLLLAGSWLCQRRSLAAYARRAGVLRSSSNPAASTTSSSSTDEV